jgi:DNA-binding transcriptional MocR family regulator
LDLITHAVLMPGERVAVEDPSFPPILDLLDAARLQVVGVGIDDEGLDPGALRAVIDSGVAALVLQPRAHNPTGVSMSLQRARTIAKLLGDHDVLVVEDDSTGAIAVAEPISLGRWIPDRVVHIRSFSKSHGPDLRLAAVSGPKTVIDPLLVRRQLGQGWTSRLLQRVLLALLSDPKTVATVAAAREEYARRRASLVQGLRSRGIAAGGTDGINMWLPVHDETATVVHLASQSVGVAPGRPFTVAGAQSPHIRVTAGLVRAGHEELAARLAVAVSAVGWGT